MTLRRLYLYVVSAVSLGLLAAGLALLGTTVLLFLFNDPFAQNTRTQLAVFTALTAVALPVWAIHFWFARRYALRDPYERASAIRRAYLYWACLASAIGALITIAITAGDLLRPLVDGCGFTGYAPLTPGDVPIFTSCPASQNWETTSMAGWVAAVFVLIWAFHFWVAARDGAAVGEEGASATLRRWYMYVALLVGLLVMLSGASSLIQVLWLRAVNSPLGNSHFIGDAAGLLIAGLVVWGFHARTVAQNHIKDDRHSTLRALQGFIALAVSIAIALFGASQILYYALARAVGVDSPGGFGNDILGGLASPASLLVVYGIAWYLMRRRLARDAQTQEDERQANIRRLYTNLAALVVARGLGDRRRGFAVDRRRADRGPDHRSHGRRLEEPGQPVADPSCRGRGGVARSLAAAALGHRSAGPAAPTVRLGRAPGQRAGGPGGRGRDARRGAAPDVQRAAHAGGQREPGLRPLPRGPHRGRRRGHLSLARAEG